MSVGGEIISIHIGGQGVKVGAAYWDLLCEEHGVLSKQGRHSDRFSSIENGESFASRDYRDRLFTETASGKFITKALFIDSDTSTIEEYIATQRYQVFADECLVTGSDDAAGCYAIGKYQVVKEIHSQVIVQLRRIMEQCEAPNLLQLFASQCGGTGSGYTTPLLTSVNDIFPMKSRHLYSHIPSPGSNTSIVSTYNCVLASAAQRELIDMFFLYDNNSLMEQFIIGHDIHDENRQFGYLEMNAIVAEVASGVTASRRFSNQYSCDPNQLQTNLVPLPLLNQLVPCVSMTNLNPKSKLHRDAFMLMCGNFENRYSLCCSLKKDKGKYIAMALLFRGNDPKMAQEMNKALHRDYFSARMEFVPWVPCPLKVGVTPRHNVVHPRLVDFVKPEEVSLVTLQNHTNICEIKRPILENYEKLMEHRAFMYVYVQNGMEEGEFISAHERCQEFIDTCHQVCEVKKAEVEEKAEQDE